MCLLTYKQNQFYNAKTNNISRAAALDKVIGFASRTLGNSIQSAIRSGFSDTKTSTKTRVSFKVIQLTQLHELYIVHKM